MNDYPFGLHPEFIWSLDETEEWDDETYRLLADEFRRRGKLVHAEIPGENLHREIRRLVVEYNDNFFSKDRTLALRAEELESYRARHGGWEWVLHDPDNLLSPAQHFFWLLEQWERRPGGPMPEDDEGSSTFDETEVWFRHWVGNDTKALPETPPYFEWAWTSPDGHRT